MNNVYYIVALHNGLKSVCAFCIHHTKKWKGEAISSLYIIIILRLLGIIKRERGTGNLAKKIKFGKIWGSERISSCMELYMPLKCFDKL